METSLFSGCGNEKLASVLKDEARGSVALTGSFNVCQSACTKGKSSYTAIPRQTLPRVRQLLNGTPLSRARATAS